MKQEDKGTVAISLVAYSLALATRRDRAWIEGLPHGREGAVALVDELSRR